MLVYADDIILLCPSRAGLQAMINVCEKFAGENNLKFSTNTDPKKSKTKCIHFSKQKIELAEIILNGDTLPWVDSALHVGNTLERNNSFTRDLRLKRGDFIGRVHSILQEFHFANPLVKMKMFSIYTTSFYGSCLWSIYDGSCDKLFTAWNIAVRMAFDLPRESRRYFIEEISETPHPKVMLSKRFLKFHETLQKSKKLSVRFLSEISSANMRTVYGQNVLGVRRQCDDIDVTSRNVMKAMKYAPVHDDDKWKIQVVKDLLEVKWNTVEIENVEIEIDEIDDILMTFAPLVSP